MEMPEEEAGKVAQHLKALFALAEDPSLVASI